MDIAGDLFNHAIHLFGLFFENPPPSKATARTWRKLELATTRIYRRVGPGVVDDPDGLRAVRRDAVRCIDLLEEVLESRHYREAALRLSTVVVLVEECLRDLGEPLKRPPRRHQH